MATSKPRLSITMNQEVYDAFREYSALLGVPLSNSVSDLCKSALPGVLTAIHVIRTGQKMQGLGQGYVRGYASAASELSKEVEREVGHVLGEGVVLALSGEDLADSVLMGVPVEAVTMGRISAVRGSVGVARRKSKKSSSGAGADSLTPVSGNTGVVLEKGSKTIH